jgi:hypothetical protein
MGISSLIECQDVNEHPLRAGFAVTDSSLRQLLAKFLQI